MLHLIELENVIQHTQDNIDKHKSIIQDRHNKKLTNLTTRIIETIPTPTHKFHTRTVNTTDISFTNDEITLLNKGLKHNLKNNTPNNNNHNRHNLCIGLRKTCLLYTSRCV